IPACGGLPHNIILDMATSQVSGSTIRQYHNQGRTIDPEWTITTKGETTLDPAHFMEGAAVLLPLGGRSTGHKGFGLALVAELLGGIAGGSMAGESEDDWFSNAGLFFFLDPLRFQPREQWERRVANFAVYLREKGGRLPGSGAHERALESLERGITISPQTATSLCRLAEDLDVEIPESLKTAGDSNPEEQVRTW
ncbi:MAG: Ldh family oxidoreductase, partial [Gammaproteobacteria bacterium]